MQDISPTLAVRAPRLISIVRRAQELLGLVSAEVTTGEDAGFFETKLIPIAAVTRSMYAAKDRLLESWNYLSGVRVADEDTLFHVLFLLIESVPDLASEGKTSPLPPEWNAPPSPVRATEANPRVYKGTKYQPPKNQRPSSIDVRSHLCDQGSLRRLLSPMWQSLPEVRARLHRTGYSGAVLDAIEREQASGKASQPWTLPARFVQHVWPLVRHQTRREVSKFRSLYGALDLDCDDRLLWAFTHLVALAGADRGYRWGLLVAVLPPPRRLLFAASLIHTTAFGRPPGPETTRQVEQMSCIATDEQFRSWAPQLLMTSDPEYLLAGFRLAAQFDTGRRFNDIGTCANFPEQIVEEIGMKAADHSNGGWLTMALWNQCGRLPGLANVIRRSAWRGFAPEAAARYFQFLQSRGYGDLTERKLLKKWGAIEREVPQIEALLLSTPPEYQTKVVNCMSDWLWTWDEPTVIRARLLRGYELIRRLAAPPFSIGHGSASAICWLIELDREEAWKRCLSAPDASFGALERACRRDNDAKLISNGLASLTRHLDLFTVEAFRSAPKKLIRTAGILGGVRAQVRCQIIQQCRKHALFQVDPLVTPIKEACSTIKDCSKANYTNPIPERLSAWVRGEIHLSTGRLERYRRIVAEKLVLTRLDVIEQSVVDWLRQDLPIENVKKTDRHALRLLGSAQDNRRGLRKFLKAHWSGDQRYLSAHPATTSWYRKHKGVPRAVWEQGIRFTAKGGLFTVEVEREPMEILKLGTYAGTCLGLGGSLSYSAIAALLDANKNVLYARDWAGTVIARQLVAISDDDRLVCFSIYPLSSGQPVKAAFRDYDQAFAQALALPLYEQSDDDTGYEISGVVSAFWWDDMSWDFNVSE